jgi:hypothetical protein
MTNDCCICLEENILEENLHYMICLHFICFKCFTKLTKDSCPLCRHPIYILQNSITTVRDHQNSDSDDSEESYFSQEFDDDFIIPYIRRDRQKYRRNKNIRKRQVLDNIIQTDFIVFEPIPPACATSRKYRRQRTLTV